MRRFKLTIGIVIGVLVVAGIVVGILYATGVLGKKGGGSTIPIIRPTFHPVGPGGTPPILGPSGLEKYRPIGVSIRDEPIWTDNELRVPITITSPPEGQATNNPILNGTTSIVLSDGYTMNGGFIGGIPTSNGNTEIALSIGLNGLTPVSGTVSVQTQYTAADGTAVSSDPVTASISFQTMIQPN